MSSFIHQNITEKRQEQDKKVRQLIAVLQLNSTKDIGTFAAQVIEFIAQETQAYQGVLYVCQQHTQQISAEGTYATALKKKFDYGEGLIGQTVISKRPLYFEHSSSKRHFVQGLMQFTPNTAIVLPLLFNQEAYGVIELVFIQSLDDQVKSFLERVAGYIAANLYNLLTNEKTEKLLQDSQAQTKELEQSTKHQADSMEILKKVREKLMKQQKELHAEHLKTKQSIQYAQRIQGAFLPTKLTRLTTFPDSFVLYMPKDIVSGDFFWCSKHGESRVVAVADCTGHGVPGAFMSVVGSNLMNEIINQQNITCPAMILAKMHQGIRQKLKQDESQNDDGMDMSICTIDPHENQSYRLTFAGAKHFMVLINPENKLKILKGDRQSIGGKNTPDNRQFTNQEVLVKSQEMIYLFSDGYIDQPQSNRRSIGRKKLQELLLSVADLPLQNQKYLIQTFLEEYMGKTPQRDDITLLGIRL